MLTLSIKLETQIAMRLLTYASHAGIDEPSLAAIELIQLGLAVSNGSAELESANPNGKQSKDGASRPIKELLEHAVSCAEGFDENRMFYLSEVFSREEWKEILPGTRKRLGSAFKKATATNGLATYKGRGKYGHAKYIRN